MGSAIAKNTLQTIENAVNTYFVTRYYRWELIEADYDDNKFADCAIAGNVEYLITQDRHFNILKPMDFPKVEVIDIKTFQNVVFSV